MAPHSKPHGLKTHVALVGWLIDAGYHEKRLLHHLLDNYNVLERPVVNESDPLQLSFGLTLMQIIDVDEKNQLLITNIWLKLGCDVSGVMNSSNYPEIIPDVGIEKG
uniref:Neurotransmitter-gated ion-channel ligand-binding domain-containing protein n=1 Tax=Anopheles farauti TaxID=69004 RepID=A0A182Q5Y8_9DIPT